MAHLVHHSTFDTAGASPLAPTRFEDNEWRIIMLAQKEGLVSLSEPGAVARFFSWLIGTRADHRLANPRLEALRRFSVLAWHYSYALPVSAISGFLKAGFSEAQLDYALASIADFRAHAALPGGTKAT